MSIELEKLKQYKTKEQKILTDTDTKHIQNYKNLISFFESAIANTSKEGVTDYPGLLSACLQCIRHLDSLVTSYETSLLLTQAANNLIDKIIKDNTPVTSVGNEKLDNDPKSKD